MGKKRHAGDGSAIGENAIHSHRDDMTNIDWIIDCPYFDLGSLPSGLAQQFGAQSWRNIFRIYPPIAAIIEGILPKARLFGFPGKQTWQPDRHCRSLAQLLNVIGDMMPIPSWSECATRLVDVATGRSHADCVVRGGKWVNVYSGEIIPDTDIAIASGRIAYVGPDASHTIGETTRVIDADSRYMVPGLCDAHMHVESGMVTVTEFARAVIPHGTTSMFIDPHEIANVLGLRGVRLMHDDAVSLPINVQVQVPSCVPSAPGLETAGAEVTVRDVAEALWS